MNQKINIAIDGYSSCGKSTIAKALAKKLGYAYVDTGAMYRAVTLYILRNHIEITDLVSIKNALENIDISFEIDSDGKQFTLLNGENVEKEIRSMEVSNFTSQVSAIKEVRQILVSWQQKIGKNKGVVMDGRDIGTVVFPDAELKLFMTASPEIRTHRRYLELTNKGESVTEEEIRNNLAHRDHLDSTREESPLRQAEDAVVLDNSFLSEEEQLDKVLDWVKEKLLEKA
jgi:cytidylate kinase